MSRAEIVTASCDLNFIDTITRTRHLPQGVHVRTEISRPFGLEAFHADPSRHELEPVASSTAEAGNLPLTLTRVDDDSSAV